MIAAVEGTAAVDDTAKPVRNAWANHHHVRESIAQFEPMMRVRPHGARDLAGDDGTESGRSRTRRLQEEEIATHLDGLGFAEQCELVASLSPRQQRMLERLIRGGRHG